jgi:signal transduction histidine kinase
MDGASYSIQALASISRIDAVPTLLKVLSEMSGLEFVAVTRIHGDTATVCALRNERGVRIKLGEAFSLSEKLGFHAKALRQPVVIEQVSSSAVARSCDPAAGAIESFISVPIIVRRRLHFGTLFAMGTRANLSEPRILSMFKQFAALIGAQLAQEIIDEQQRLALLDERATNQLRERFIAILGHDLRSPLQAVFATADLLERKLGDSPHAQLAARIKGHGRRMSLLIDDVLDFARARLGGGIGLDLTEVENLSTGLATVVQELRDAQPSCEILADIRVSQSVRCDLGRVQQVAANLLGNALTHGQAGSPVSITVRTDAHELVLEVWNSGEPIPVASLGKIFEPFWRHSVSASRNGLGLGLHICSEIVRAHQGRMSVTSNRQKGTRFTAYLPLAAPIPAIFDSSMTIASSGDSGIKSSTTSSS